MLCCVCSIFLSAFDKLHLIISKLNSNDEVVNPMAEASSTALEEEFWAETRGFQFQKVGRDQVGSKGTEEQI